MIDDLAIDAFQILRRWVYLFGRDLEGLRGIVFVTHHEFDFLSAAAVHDDMPSGERCR